MKFAVLVWSILLFSLGLVGPVSGESLFDVHGHELAKEMKQPREDEDIATIINIIEGWLCPTKKVFLKSLTPVYPTRKNMGVPLRFLP